MKKISILVLLSVALNLLAMTMLSGAQDADSNHEKALKMVQKEYSQNLIPALNILQRNTQDELFIEGWKVESAFERILTLDKLDRKSDPYLEINKNYDLAVKSRYNKYRNIYIVSYLFALGDRNDYAGFYWWVDPTNHLILDISNNRRLCQKYRLKQYSETYISTLRLKTYQNEIQMMKSEINL